jgi:hypothetical protein
MGDHRFTFLWREKFEKSSTHDDASVGGKMPVGESLWSSIVDDSETRERDTPIVTYPLDKRREMLG